MKQTPIQLQIESPLFEQTSWSLRELQPIWQCIINWLGPGTSRIFPPPIQDIGKLGNLGSIGKAVTRFRDIPGFQELGKELGADETSGSWTTMYLALQIDDIENCELLEFEPAAGPTSKADLAADLFGVRHLFECKATKPNDIERPRRHEIIDLIKRDIPEGVQITICYEKDLSNKEWHELGVTIAERSDSVTQEGAIIQNPDLQVIAQPGQSPLSAQVDACRMEGFLEKGSNDLLPMSTYVAGNTRLALAGPRTEAKSFIKKAFSSSRHQRLGGSPFILVVDVSMLGVSLPTVADAARTMFQPDRNTSYSGVLAVKRTATGDGTQLTSVLVGNPFAKHLLATALTRHWPSQQIPARFDSPIGCEKRKKGTEGLKIQINKNN